MMSLARTLPIPVMVGLLSEILGEFVARRGAADALEDAGWAECEDRSESEKDDEDNEPGDE